MEKIKLLLASDLFQTLLLIIIIFFLEKIRLWSLIYGFGKSLGHQIGKLL